MLNEEEKTERERERERGEAVSHLSRSAAHTTQFAIMRYYLMR